MTDPSARRVAMYTGALFHHDAISRCLTSKLDAIAHARAAGRPIEAHAIVSHSDVVRPDIRVRPGASGVVHDEWFWTADTHIYEYGIWYEAFDTVFVVPKGTRTVAWYHNVTPPTLARTDESRALLHRSCGKKENLSAFDHIVCVSPFSRDELLADGVEPDRVSVVPLPPGVPVAACTRGRRKSGDPIRLLYLGRFGEAKGVLDLVAALEIVTRRTDVPFSAVFAGNERLSSPSVTAELRERAARPPLRGLVTVINEPDDAQVASLYARADAVVIPSHHEGYCVPAVEAVAAGTKVIATDAGNLPNILAGVGVTVPVCDEGALAEAIVDLMERTATNGNESGTVRTTDGIVSEVEWQARVEAHRRAHSIEAFEQGFWKVLES